MSSAVRSTTLQAALLNVTSVIIAQLLTRYRGPGLAVTSSAWNPLGLEYIPILQFLGLSLVLTPPNVLWQQFLEQTFPGYPHTKEKQKLKVDDDGEGVVVEQKLHVTNTAIKWLLDQTVGSWANNVAFIVVLTAIRGGSADACLNAVRTRFWDLQMDAYKLWPFVSIANFLFVPPSQRVVVGSAVGLFWNVYLVLKTAQ